MDYSKKIFEMLDIKPEEEFKLQGCLNKYKISVDLTLKWYDEEFNEWNDCQSFTIFNILVGQYEIVKILKLTENDKIAIQYAKACGCKYIARDENENLFAYKSKPIILTYASEYVPMNSEDFITIESNFLPFIEWGDKPLRIEEL